MRAVVQRVSWARVRIGDRIAGEIGPGLTVLLGVTRGDDEKDADKLARKLVDLRIFADAEQKMNRSLGEVAGEMLVVSQFTLMADLRRGRRPYFGDAELPERANRLCDRFCQSARAAGVRVETGEFGAMMAVELCNDGPVTIVVDTAELMAPRRANKN